MTRRFPILARLAVTLAVAATTAPVHAQQSSLELRGGAAPPAGSIVRCTAEGVVLVSSLTGEITIGWDRVRSVSGEHAEAASEFMDVADKAWRATTRLERGDIAAAEPLLEELFADYAGQQGPTASAVCGGLLRCRLERGAHTLAVGAWLAWLHTRDDGTPAAPGSESSTAFSPTTDDETGLAPELPPIWLSLPAVRVFGQTPLNADRFGDRAAELAELYQHAALLESGQQQPMPRLESNDPGVRMVWEIVAARSPIENERLTGRRAIEKRLKSEPIGWTDAWLRTALGRSLLREADPEQQRRGVIELLRVRVEHERDAPYLAGLALAEAAVTMRTLGDDAAASLLRRELLDTFPGHPASTWEPVSRWAAAPGRPPHEPDIQPHRLTHLRIPDTSAVARPESEQSRSPHG